MNCKQQPLNVVNLAYCSVRRTSNKLSRTPRLLVKLQALNGLQITNSQPAPTSTPTLVSTPETQTSTPNELEDLTANLLVQCPDRKGVVASLAQLLAGYGCNILQSDQFKDESSSTFFQRINFDYSEMTVGSGNTLVLEKAIEELASRFQMEWSVNFYRKLKKVAILVSKYDHCLYDLLLRHRAGELRCSIPLIVSNHEDLRQVANIFGIEFRCFPVGDKSQRYTQENQIEEALKEFDIDVVVLARYMQILSEEFCARNWKHTINIHHSFLPAFEGAKPYHRAHERGVKLVGATAHYATSDLDAGPIIEQDVTRITHRDGVQDMIRKGRDLERLVLARAVRSHLEDRIMVHGNRTVVFED